MLTTDTFPEDIDTTAIAFNVFTTEKEVVNPILDEIAQCIDNDGIILVGYSYILLFFLFS